jgi:hypothetical protein
MCGLLSLALSSRGGEGILSAASQLEISMKEIPDLRASRIVRVSGLLFSRRILRRLLIGLVAFITLIMLVYAEENWRGKRAWEQHKRRMTAMGEVWDWSAFIPQPVPDEQNIFKAPKMSEWFLDRRPIYEAPLDHPITNDFARRLLNTNSTVEITNVPEAASYLAWSGQFQDDFDTIAAALKRPYARIMDDYSHYLSIQLPNRVTGYQVIITLEQRAKCHLLLGQIDKAWQELVLMNELRRLVDGQGNFLTTEGDWMIRGIINHSLPVIARGMELRAWQEDQLHALQDRLRNSDVIAQHAQALRCGRALLFSSVETGELLRAQRMAAGNNFWALVRKHPEVLLFSLAPHGALEQMFIRKSKDFQAMINAFSPTNGIVRPGDVSRASAWWKRAQEGTPALLRMQTLINEGQIACALERYRLARGEYPETLDALAPGFIQQLPRDIVNGEPLKYRRADNGKFLLYSVGWNETDEGGKDASNVSRPETLKNGDWAWISRP